MQKVKTLMIKVNKILLHLLLYLIVPTSSYGQIIPTYSVNPILESTVPNKCLCDLN